jgi:hypothetical protein
VDDYHPELANYEPHERPLRSPRTTLMMRGVVIVALVALILPGIITTYSFAQSTAKSACATYVQAEVNEQNRTEVRFEFMGEGVIGWECYAITATGERHIVSLGLIPGLPSQVPGTVNAL